MGEQFEKDVINGLSSQPKRLPSKYFYDKAGDRLFQQIMHLDEYYLTNSELEVLTANRQDIFSAIAKGGTFDLLEFGAGDGLKTKVLLKYFLKEQANFTYRPVDISSNALKGLEANLSEELPGLKVESIADEYFHALNGLGNSKNRSVVLFLGSNIGNFREEQAHRFLGELYASLKEGDMVLIGFDLKKDPGKILAAYNDDKGITAAFNLNLLRRINRELGADFDLEAFRHYPLYDPEAGEARSYLVSTREQTVQMGSRSFHFQAWETIHTEISCKYHPSETNELARHAGFEVVRHFFDKEMNFLDALWKK